MLILARRRRRPCLSRPRAWRDWRLASPRAPPRTPSARWGRFSGFSSNRRRAAWSAACRKAPSCTFASRVSLSSGGASWRLATPWTSRRSCSSAGVNVTRMVKRYEYAHWPQSNGAYRAQAKSIDATFGGTGLEDTTRGTSLRRRRESHGRGRLGSTHGVQTVTFADDVPFSDDDAADALDRIFNPASLATMGPGEIRAAWTSPNILRVILPEARRSGLCAAWRAVRADALAEALAGNTPDVPVREWVRPEDVELPEDFHLEFGGIDAWYPQDSGFSVDPRLRVRMGAETGAETETGVKISGRATSAGVNVWSSRRPARMARGTVRSRGVSSPWTRRDGPAFLASTRRISAPSTPPSPPRTPAARDEASIPRRAPSSTRRTRSPPTSPRATAPSPTPRSPRDENAVPFRIFAPRRVTTRTKRPARDR